MGKLEVIEISWNFCFRRVFTSNYTTETISFKVVNAARDSSYCYFRIVIFALLLILLLTDAAILLFLFSLPLTDWQLQFWIIIGTISYSYWFWMKEQRTLPTTISYSYWFSILGKDATNNEIKSARLTTNGLFKKGYNTMDYIE